MNVRKLFGAVAGLLAGDLSYQRESAVRAPSNRAVDSERIVDACNMIAAM